MQQVRSHRGSQLALRGPCLCRKPAKAFKSANKQGRIPPAICQAKGQSYHVEVTVSEDEDPEGVFKRFRNSCNLAGMVYEARRRQHFENRQDIKKRKQQEKGQKKIRDMREKYMVTYEEIHTDTPPFVDLFTGEDDMYDIAGEISPGYRRRNNFASRDDMGELEEDDDKDDEGVVEMRARPVKGSARPESAAGSGPKSGFVGRNTENFSRRIIPSQGPSQQKGPSSSDTAAKPKNQVETARVRRAAKQQQSTPSGSKFSSAGVGSKPVKGGNKAKSKK